MDLSTISTAQTTATSLSNLILVTPDSIGYQPQNVVTDSADGKTPAQPESFLFDYEGEQSISLTSDITDHFIEDNTAIQDQIALRPTIVNTHGFIGELNDVVPKALKPLKTAVDKLIAVSAYTPELSITAQLAYNNAAQIYATAKNLKDNAVATWNTINGTAGVSVITGNGIETKQNQNKQQVAFQKFFGYWSSRTLFTIQTPWAIFKDMAILSLRAVQDADTRVITDFEVSFKQMRFANTIKLAIEGEQTLYNPQNFQQRASTQGATQVNKGVITPTPAQPLASNLQASGRLVQ